MIGPYDSAKPVVQQTHCLSLHDQLVLAIPADKAGALKFCSVFSGKKIVITQPSLLICANPEGIEGDKSHWFLHSITLSHLIEILATVDSAMGNSLLCHRGKELVAAHPWPEVISISSTDYSTRISANNIAVDLILRHHAEFSIWCELLRKYEAYGIMCFLLSSSEQKDNISITYLSERYGVSAAYFRYLYKQSFNNTAKRKMMSVRMAYAVLQLIESEASILDVGLEAGYCSASHFTNDIKKELGLTPSEIRRLEAMLYEI